MNAGNAERLARVLEGAYCNADLDRMAFELEDQADKQCDPVAGSLLRRAAAKCREAFELLSQLTDRGFGP